jgi:ferric-dicitrate binding protein FerR (iron transport regulator)
MLDGSRVRFAEKTRFIMQRAALVDEKKETNVRVHMAVGRSWANVIRRITGRSVFELSCNNAVAGVRGTVYRMNVHEDNSALVKVYEGSVEVSRWTGQPAEDSVPLGEPKKVAGPTPIPGPKAISMEEWTYLIKSMQQIRINADGTTEKPQSFDAKEDRDDWVRWNQSRDANEAKPARDDASEG